MIFISPIMAFSTLKVDSHIEENQCCVTSNAIEEKKDHSCCSKLSTENENNGCADKNCNSNTCQFTQISTFHVFIPKSYTLDNLNSVFSENSKFDFYQSLIIKDLTDSSWKPPKYIS